MGFWLESLQFYLHEGGYGSKPMELPLHPARVSEFTYLKLVVHHTPPGWPTSAATHQQFV